MRGLSHCRPPAARCLSDAPPRSMTYPSSQLSECSAYRLTLGSLTASLWVIISADLQPHPPAADITIQVHESLGTLWGSKFEPDKDHNSVWRMPHPRLLASHTHLLVAFHASWLIRLLSVPANGSKAGP